MTVDRSFIIRGQTAPYAKGNYAMSQVRVAYPSLSKSQLIEKLRQACVSLKGKLSISRMILYGSYAQDRYTAGSDIDLVVVYRGKPTEDAYKLVMEEIRLPRLEPKLYTEEQFSTLIRSNPRFADMLDREGVTIPGM